MSPDPGFLKHEGTRTPCSTHTQRQVILTDPRLPVADYKELPSSCLHPSICGKNPTLNTSILPSAYEESEAIGLADTTKHDLLGCRRKGSVVKSTCCAGPLVTQLYGVQCFWPLWAPACMCTFLHTHIHTHIQNQNLKKKLSLMLMDIVISIA